MNAADPSAAEAVSAEPAFRAAHDQHGPALLGFLIRISGRPDVAQDLSQETWLRWVRHASRLRPGSNVRAWLYAVARNLWISQLRREGQDARAQRLLEGRPKLSPPSPEDRAASRQTLRTVQVALDAMSPPTRAAAARVLIDDLPQAEAATELGIAPEALRQRLARARAVLALHALGALSLVIWASQVFVQVDP